MLCANRAETLCAQGGPYTAVGDAPLICHPTLGGAIDPSPFVASDGTMWLVWKNDGNSIGVITVIWLQQLTPDGLSVASGPIYMVHNDQVIAQCPVPSPAAVPILEACTTGMLMRGSSRYQQKQRIPRPAISRRTRLHAPQRGCRCFLHRGIALTDASVP